MDFENSKELSDVSEILRALFWIIPEASNEVYEMGQMVVDFELYEQPSVRSLHYEQREKALLAVAFAGTLPNQSKPVYLIDFDILRQGATGQHLLRNIV